MNDQLSNVINAAAYEYADRSVTNDLVNLPGISDRRVLGLPLGTAIEAHADKQRGSQW
jgi:hypothetical protein